MYIYLIPDTNTDQSIFLHETNVFFIFYNNLNTHIL